MGSSKSDKIVAIIEVIVLLISMIVYFIKVCLPDIKKNIGSSDRIISYTNYLNMFEVNIDGDVDFAFVVNKDYKINHIMFFSKNTRCLYNQNIENYEDMSAEQKEILDQFINAETDLSNAAFDNLFNLYNINIEGFKNMTDEQQDILMNSMIPQWNSGVQQMADKITGEGGFLPTCKDAFEELDQATNDYMTGIEELQKQANVNFEDIKNGIDESITATEELLADNNELIDSYEAEIEAIKGVLDQLDGLITKYEEASEAAKKATEDAKNYWLAEQNKNADVKDNIENIAAEKEANQPAQITEAPKPEETKPAAPSLNLGSYVTVKPGTKWYADSWGGGSWGYARAGSIAYTSSGPYGYNIGGLGWVRKSDIVGYDTGGYTGD